VEVWREAGIMKTAEEIVRALASIGDGALARLEEAAATCKSIEEAAGDGRGHFIRPGEEARADTELAAAREVIAAPYRLAVEWVKGLHGNDVPPAADSNPATLARS
jgi:hypothetical protein